MADALIYYWYAVTAGYLQQLQNMPDPINLEPELA